MAYMYAISYLPDRYENDENEEMSMLSAISSSAETERGAVSPLAAGNSIGIHQSC
jgi:hypothetical protein